MNKQENQVKEADAKSLEGYDLPIFPVQNEAPKMLIPSEKILANRHRYKEEKPKK